MKENLSQEEYQHMNNVFNIVQSGIKDMLKVMKENYIDYQYKYTGLLEHEDIRQALSACSEQLPQQMLHDIDRWLPCNNLVALDRNDRGVYGLVRDTEVLLPIYDYYTFYKTEYMGHSLETIIPIYDVYAQLKDVINYEVIKELDEHLQLLRHELYKASLRYYEFSDQDLTKDNILDNQVILNTIIYANNDIPYNRYDTDDTKKFLQYIIDSSDTELQNSLVTACNQLIHKHKEAKIFLIEGVLSQDIFNCPQAFQGFCKYFSAPKLEEQDVYKIFSNMIDNCVSKTLDKSFDQQDQQLATDNPIQR